MGVDFSCPESDILEVKKKRNFSLNFIHELDPWFNHRVLCGSSEPTRLVRAWI